ncbi:hypothetical protein DFH11DRAFT_784999 [Phellopilus nigrolimitatus]|nr:hypothetical protein DFH11DRAFT_784999 [Phellopilus nigrolimitatus]
MTAYIGSAGALYAARSNSFIKYGVDVGLSLARIQVADGSEHVSSNLAHAASGMYAWEAAQFILYDCRVLFSLLGRALRLFRPIWPCTGKWFNGQGTGGDQNTVDYLRKSRTGKGRDTTSEIPPVRPATTQVQPAPSLPSSVVVDETSSSSSFERRRRLRETSTKTANVFARLAFLSLRVTTFTALVSLLTILDSPGGFLSSNESKFSSGSSPTPLNVIDVKGMLSCGTWRIVNVVAWAFPLISFALSTSFLFLRIMALWYVSPALLSILCKCVCAYFTSKDTTRDSYLVDSIPFYSSPEVTIPLVLVYSLCFYLTSDISTS